MACLRLALVPRSRAIREAVTWTIYHREWGLEIVSLFPNSKLYFSSSLSLRDFNRENKEK